MVESVSIDSSGKKETHKMDYYIFDIFSPVTTLLLNIVINCYYCISDTLKQKKITNKLL